MCIVSTIPEKCKRCYTCVRECPAKAIKVEGGQAMVIEERCIACGNCVKVCAQGAKLIEDSTGYVGRVLHDKNIRVFACLAPSFPAAFYSDNPAKIISAIRKLGFDEIWEVAFGAELISKKYVELFEKSQVSGDCVITSPCPAIVAYVEKYVPTLHDILAPIVSPMIAVARAIRKRHGNDVKIVFIGPCIAKKNEIRDPSVAGTVDAVLTFKELSKLFADSDIKPGMLRESGFDSPRSRLGRSFAISGGLLKTSGLSTDILENDIVITEGKDRVLSALKELAEAKTTAQLLDVLFCEGCINGPKMLNDLSVFTRKEILADFVNDQARYTTQKEYAEAIAEFNDLDLSRNFTRQNLILPQPEEKAIENVLLAMRKFSPEDQLNCGACGYHSCREKAIAVCQGLAEAEMCLPYLVEELENTCDRLQSSHKELKSAHQRLLQTERLASMGQLSAAVAHEINNPLGTVLLFSHILLKRLKGGEPEKEDIEMIVSEATRCKGIVRGLLDFARQSRLSKSSTNIKNLLGKVLSILKIKAQAASIDITSEIEENIPLMMVDEAQIKQMFLNIIENGIDAISDGGKIRVNITHSGTDGIVIIKISDTGCGISGENLSKLFTPFFTTKEDKKGTGLGLAIVYGIVKMHCGDISVESELGHGTTFRICLPVSSDETENEHNGMEFATVNAQIEKGGEQSVL